MPYERKSSLEANTTTALAVLSAQFGRVDLAGPLRFRQTRVGDEMFTINNLRISDAVPGQVEPRHVDIAYASHDYRWTTARHEGALHLSPALFSPTSPLTTLGGSRGRLTIVSLEQAPLDRLAQAAYGLRARATFASPLPVSSASAASWRHLVELVMGLPLAGDIVRRKVYRALGFLALEAFRLSGDPDERRGASRARIGTFRAAVDHMHRHADAPIGVADVALEVGTTIADLRRLFAAYEPDGRSPELVLRQVRLAGAHRALLAADAAHTSIRMVASQWGFAYIGHFTRCYLETYDRLPGESLAEQRGRMRPLA